LIAYGEKMKINNLEKFKTKVAKQLCLGMVISLSDPAVSELAGDAGWDFTWIDMEHSPMGIETALGHVMAARGTNTAPFIRVPGNDPVLIKPILELAPAGIIIPMVNSAEEATAAVSACRYPPHGIRGCGPKRGMLYGALPFKDYLEISKTDPMIIIQIEHIKALEKLDEILSVDGIDSICVGPCDLSASMGKLGETDDLEVEVVIDKICAKAREANVMIGSAIGYDQKAISKWQERGARWLAVAGDYGCIMSVSKDILLPS
jgi:2-keto-3-deoxy-L-rhamnonate aldolase RhmA